MRIDLGGARLEASARTGIGENCARLWRSGARYSRGVRLDGCLKILNGGTGGRLSREISERTVLLLVVAADTLPFSAFFEAGDRHDETSSVFRETVLGASERVLVDDGSSLVSESERW